MKTKAGTYLGYYGPKWDKKIQDRDNPDYWKYGVANLVFLDFVKNKRRILDIGCGTGGSTLFLAKNAPLEQIIGIDPVRSMIRVAKKHAVRRKLGQKTDFIMCDGRCLPLRRFSFDGLVSRGDAFVFLVPQEIALLEFKRVLKNDAVLIMEMDNAPWQAGEIISYSFEKMLEGSIAYCVERFYLDRNHVKTFYVLNPEGSIVKEVSRNPEFVKTGKVRKKVPLREIKEETIETKLSATTHWPTADELKTLFAGTGFKSIEIFGTGLLMALILEGNPRVIAALRKQPEVFFEIEARLVRLVDPQKARALILKTVA